MIYAPTHYYFEMLQSFAFQMFIISLVLCLIFIFSKSWILSLISILSIGLLSQIFTIFPSESKLHPNFSIAHFNVLKLNNTYSQTINAALESKADFISDPSIS
jgi:c-di-AMP phosphodiesterase-like protein